MCLCSGNCIDTSFFFKSDVFLSCSDAVNNSRGVKEQNSYK